MTSVTTTTQQAAASTKPATPTVTEKPKSAISSDFETFLKMLTAQMQNQDPLNPIESSDYAVQLATFSGVEQQVKTNDLLRSLTENNAKSGLAELSGWIGREVPAAGAVEFDGSTPLTIVPAVNSKATRSVIEVRSGDAVVQRFDVPTDGKPIQWDGLTDGGTAFGSGTYKFLTYNYNDTTHLTTSATPVYQTVTEVRTNDRGGQLVLKGGNVIEASTVTALRAGS